ncbi:hypothetical protein EJB05_53727, partial [Eragrostis curvula]
INECTRPNEYPCNGVCKDVEGSYHCTCRPGFRTINGDPTKEKCIPKFPFEAQLALGISLGMLVLAVALLFTLMKDAGIFQEKWWLDSSKSGEHEDFHKGGAQKITKNNSHVLGKGGFGEVYKGILDDNTMVAVKASIVVNEARKEDFTNEVIIQSQMIHKNIIKLLGCCLEVDVPMLVYEFAANGNLQEVLHGDDKRQLRPLSLDLRLDIAIESAEGLTYMHSATNRTIRHGDVKTANILLDDNFMPKISDFGTSKLLTVDKDFTMFVVGSMGYIDPVFHKTGHLTQKSDVYSFGVVLPELICRKPTIYDGSCSLMIEFQNAYELENSGRAMFDKDIAVTEEDRRSPKIVKGAISWPGYKFTHECSRKTAAGVRRYFIGEGQKLIRRVGGRLYMTCSTKGTQRWGTDRKMVGGESGVQLKFGEVQGAVQCTKNRGKNHSRIHLVLQKSGMELVVDEKAPK